MNDKYSSSTITEDGRLLLKKMEREGVESVWDRFQAQLPNCGYCEMGLSCRICVMGPCRIDPFGEGPQRGVCGADADIMVARNLGRMIAAGAASHSDHGRDLVEVLGKVAVNEAPGYQLRDVEKLKRVAAEFGITAEGKKPNQIAAELSDAMAEEYGTRKKELTLLNRAPAKRQEVWRKLGVAPRGIDRETSEMMHRTHMGVDNDWKSLLLHGIRNALSDGWGGSMIATEVSDILFGTPKPGVTRVNAGVLKKDQVNIIVHGHNPVVSEMLLHACQDPDLLKMAKDKGANGINLAGVCCTGNELLMRAGIPMAGNHLTTELVLATGAVDMMVVDYQCIMPSLGTVAACYHTKMVSTSDKARFPGMEHQEFHPENAAAKAKTLVKDAIANFDRRGEVFIPVESVECMGGFSVEAIVGAFKDIHSDKVSLEVIHSDVGAVTESDVLLATTGEGGIILGFHTRVDNSAAELAKREGVQIKLYAIIYELIDQVKLAMAGLLPPVLKETVFGTAEVRKVFALSKGGNVAGCLVANGRVTKGKVRVMRRRNLLFEGILKTLRRFQDDVSEVRAGMECGIQLDGFNDFQEGDTVECYSLVEVQQVL